MKDRFRFRVWSTYSSRWIYGVPVCNKHKSIDMFRFIAIRDDACNQEWAEHELDRNTVGQCTGLKDRNGKLIYEGDIVRICDHVVAVVKWNQPFGAFGVSAKHKHINGRIISDHMYAPDGCLEVIGNIHQDSHLLDNPELLENDDEG